MEDIFQWLIWLFIIISFFASFFKKKEQPKKTEPRQRYDQWEEQDQFPVKSQSGTSVDQEEYDILQEIENMFKTSTSKPTQIEQREYQQKMDTFPTESEHVSYEGSRREDEYTSYERERSPREAQRMDTSRTSAEQVLTSSEHVFESAIKRPTEIARQNVRQIDASVSKQAEAFEHYLKKKDETINLAAVIRKRIRQPETLKEYIIFSEIIRRPDYRSGRSRTLKR